MSQLSGMFIFVYLGIKRLTSQPRNNLLPLVKLFFLFPWEIEILSRRWPGSRSAVVTWGKWLRICTSRSCAAFCLRTSSFTVERLLRKHKETDINLLAAGFFFFFLCNDLLFSALTFFYLLVSMPMRSFLNDQFFLSCISFRKALSLPHTEYDLSVFLLLFLVFLFDILPLPPVLQSFRATKVRVSTKWGFGGKVTFSLSPFPIMFLMCGVPSVVLWDLCPRSFKLYYLSGCPSLFEKVFSPSDWKMVHFLLLPLCDFLLFCLLRIKVTLFYG